MARMPCVPASRYRRAAMDELQGARNDDAPLHPCDAWANATALATTGQRALFSNTPPSPNLSPSLSVDHRRTYPTSPRPRPCLHRRLREANLTSPTHCVVTQRCTPTTSTAGAAPLCERSSSSSSSTRLAIKGGLSSVAAHHEAAVRRPTRPTMTTAVTTTIAKTSRRPGSGWRQRRH